MTTAEGLEHTIIETLATETDPIDAGSDQGLEIMLIKAGWIHLQGDLRSGLNAKLPTQPLEQGMDLLRRQKRRSSPADINGGQRRSFGGKGDLSMQLFQVGID